jgi:hypothetical protein
MIWFVTSIYLAKTMHDENPVRVEAKRTFGYFHHEIDALDAVAENRCNMHECLYNYLVIERVPSGIHAMAESEQWYQWDEVENKWAFCTKPTTLEGIISWAVG